MNTIRILGIEFVNDTIYNFFEKLRANKGLVTVPSGPGLATIKKEPEYYHSLLESDYVVADSGYMVLIWNLISKKKTKKLSGPMLIEFFLNNFADYKESLFLVNPNEENQNANIELLKSFDVEIGKEDCYLAPFYNGNIVDPELLRILESKKPTWIMLNLGGGVQENLGFYLRNNLSYKPAILCTGAAIAFRTGQQARMPLWIDRIYFGWLFRIVTKPSLYLPRYLAAFKLLFILIKYRERQVGKE